MVVEGSRRCVSSNFNQHHSMWQKSSIVFRTVIPKTVFLWKINGLGSLKMTPIHGFRGLTHLWTLLSIIWLPISFLLFPQEPWLDLKKSLKKNLILSELTDILISLMEKKCEFIDFMCWSNIRIYSDSIQTWFFFFPFLTNVLSLNYT